MAGPAYEQIDFPIIDSHIHLYARDHIEDLAWTSILASDHALNRQYSVAEYRAASKSQPNLVGFVFVETDRKSSLSEDGWTHPLAELDFLKRIKAGTPKAEEGHTSEDKSFLLGAVPWAPLPTDQSLLTTYLDRMNSGKDENATQSDLVKGFRYLVQDKPHGTQLKPNFINNLLTLERQGLKTFDLGVDFHRNGASQLQESIDMLSEFYVSSTNSLKIVLNHLCKPDLCTPTPKSTSDTSNESFKTWSILIRKFSTFPTTVVKLSGLFSELPPPSPTDPLSTLDYLSLIRPYTRVIFECFGADRIMFGSDWPVCNVGGPGPETSWACWVTVVDAVLGDLDLSRKERARIWAGTANEVYGLGVELEDVTEEVSGRY